MSVARRLSEQARTAQPPNPADAFNHLSSGLGGMVEHLRGMVGQLAEALQASNAAGADPGGNAGSHRAASHEAKLGGASVVFGYTLRMGSDGVSAEPFGHVPAKPDAGPRAGRTGGSAAALPVARQPIVEVTEDGGDILVVAELPGADPASITCRADGARLIIAAEGAWSYRKEVGLPHAVRADVLQQDFQNGILELRLRQAAAP
jgi:HSP20 family molecular chaperone IbpA